MLTTATRILLVWVALNAADVNTRATGAQLQLTRSPDIVQVYEGTWRLDHPRSHLFRLRVTADGPGCPPGTVTATVLCQ